MLGLILRTCTNIHTDKALHTVHETAKPAKNNNTGADGYKLLKTACINLFQMRLIISGLVIVDEIKPVWFVKGSR